MMNQSKQIVRFSHKGEASFYEAVKAGVDQYFKQHNISPHGNFNMWVKMFVMLLLYVGPYICIVTGLGSDSVWLYMILCVLMGLGIVGLGTSVMHDANHGALSRHKKVNAAAGHLMELVGGYSTTWKIQHNILHHTYTNVEGLDEDIDTVKLLRFSPNKPLYWFHRYQFIYAWFLYALLTLFWMSAKHFIQLHTYHRLGLLRKQRISFRKAYIQVSLLSVFYFGYTLALPLLFSGMPWYIVVAGYFAMHLVAGFLLSCIFQPSHIVETSTFETPVEDKGTYRMKNSWAVHEMLNTANFAPGSRITSWFIGGLNYQIEHHLFPSICHVHYRKISAIVKSVALAYGLPYNVQPTFLQAIYAHGKMLRQLGRR
jgi:linoleoyl-CoA desaturase